MATRSSSSVSITAPTAAERLAAYRAAAASLTPRATAAPERSAAEVFGKIGADSRNFFTNVAAVYKVERDLGRM
jgi:hypothetical protein